MTKLTQRDIENFWIRCYFNPSLNLTEAVIDRAYRDFNRTLHGIGKEQTKDKYLLLRKSVIKIVSELLLMTFNSQEEFDVWHEVKCSELVKAYLDISSHKLYVGQAQKWINMSLKYLYALGEDRIIGISKNYSYFHFPVDNIIQNLFFEKGISKFKIAWSRIDDYSEYLDYQLRVREQFKEQIVLDVEFILFNKTFV